MSEKFLLIPHLRIINAQAASTPYTVGFPAMTAWLGLVHALERSIRQTEPFHEARLPRVAVSCHSCDLQVFRDKNNRYGSLIGMKKPLRKKQNSNEFLPAQFIEESRCHLEVSLLIEVTGLESADIKAFEDVVRKELPRLKGAGGDIVLSCHELYRWRVYEIAEDDTVTAHKIKNRLMPGHVIIERQDLMEHEAGTDSIDRMLDVMQGICPSDGWIVPIAVGFRDLSGNLKVKNQRSYDHDHHFVEPLVTMGEFIIPYRLKSIQDMMWSYEYREADGLYLCKNNGKKHSD